MYEQVGGEPFFVRLIDSFYQHVENDELLRPMYPQDLTESRRHMVLFLTQYWGGPTTYMAEHGHPRLSMRHAPFAITKRAKDAWMSAMTNALDSVKDDLTQDQYDEFFAYFDMAARQMRNV